MAQMGEVRVVLTAVTDKLEQQLEIAQEQLNIFRASTEIARAQARLLELRAKQ